MAKVLVIGSGGREHALACKIASSGKIGKVYVNPGNAGTANAGDNPIFNNKISNSCDVSIEDHIALPKWCKQNAIDLVVVGSEVPLASGICDALLKTGVKCFGPAQNAAALEADKSFAKDFMTRHGIPTARFKSFTSVNDAVDHINNAEYPALVVKASGLAAGKGAFVCSSKEDACMVTKQMIEDKMFGTAGETVVVEELLQGEEFSVLCFTDGHNIAVMPPVQDHKQVYEGDSGPNTGGMGAYGPCPQLDVKWLDFIKRHILQKTVDGMREDNRKFVGIIYAGIMMTDDGPKVLEFNCRFGDPECQVLLSLLDSDLYEMMEACLCGNLQPDKVAWKYDKFSVCIVLASAGYPGKYDKGKVISGIENADAIPGITVYEAGTSLCTKKVTSGGRVLSVCSLASSLQSAADLALKGAVCIKFDGSFYRRDIAYKGLEFVKRYSGMTYASCGVSVDKGNALIDKISPMASATSRNGCKVALGGFGAFFDLASAGYENPVLVSGTDGVGTKLLLAQKSNCHSSIGQDLVAMCVNDILTHNAEPLFFLDYFSCGTLKSKTASQVVEGIAKACKLAGCALVGGETAEMPGMYPDNGYDLAGFAVGAYDKVRDLQLPRSDEICPGDVIIGISSSGLHSNGFSLVRAVLKNSGIKLMDTCPFEQSKSVVECLLTPTAVYNTFLLPVLRSNRCIKAVAHITGGGILENLARVLPNDLRAELDANTWHIQPVFGWISKAGKVASHEMLRTFNCGIGMCLIVSSEYQDHVLQQCIFAASTANLNAYSIGLVKKSSATKDKVVVRNFNPALNASWIMAKIKSNAVDDEPSSLEGDGKIHVAVFISGTGTNLQALIDHSKEDNASYVISLVISNKKSASGLAKASSADIPTVVLSHNDYSDRESYDHALHQILVRGNIQIICLAGFMRLLSGWFTCKWRGRILNIHPSLLPAFKGVNAHEQVLKSGVRVSGCTVHFVTESMDDGAIIVQKVVEVQRGDNIDTLSERVKSVEHVAYPMALDLVVTKKVSFDANKNAVIWEIQ